MKNVVNGLKRFIREEDAPTMAEYGLLLVFIALVVVAGANVLGTNLNTLFTESGNAVGNVTPPALPQPNTGGGA